MHDRAGPDLPSNKTGGEAARRGRLRSLAKRDLLDHIPAIVYVDVVDPHVSGGYRNLYMSAHFETLLGYTPQEVKDDPDLWPEIIHPEDRQAVLAREAAHYASGEPLQQEIRLLARDGEVVWVKDRATFLADEQGRTTYSVGVLTDIGEQKRLQADLARQAVTDPLTGLPNRLLFEDRVRHALAGAVRRGDACAVLFIDLDRFKTINDSLGHGSGDGVLRVCAERLAAPLRASDTIARVGGDEFAVLVEQIESAVGAVVVAERLLAALEPPLVVEGRTLSVRASIGIAVATHDHAAPHELVRAADLAMYEAKAAGRGGYALFEPAMHAAALDRLALEQDLRAAAATEAFTLAYQPIIELPMERTVGAEALLRWSHPSRGSIPPAEFLPLAEELGEMPRIGRWVLAEACRTAARWVREELVDDRFAIHVNLSVPELREPGLIDATMMVLRETGLAPGRLVLELTETGLHEAGEVERDRLHALRDLGVCVALDDFGIGQSSLGRLAELPLDILKLDRSFLAGLDGSPAAAAVVEAVVRLGGAMDLPVVAEGVEEPKQVARLAEAGCRYAQGYLFGRPDDAEAMERRLRTSSAR